MNSQEEIVPKLGVERMYFDFLVRNEWRIQRCCGCTKHVFYPRQICPFCGEDGFDWIEPSGKAIVYSFSVVHGDPKADGQFNVALVDLDEGVRMMTRIEGIDPQEIKIGMRVRAKIVMDEAVGSNIVVFEAIGS